MTQQRGTGDRAPLSRQRVLRAAVALADETGAEAFSMRRLAQELGVVPMALYKHVANKEELLDGMVDLVVGDIAPPAPGAPWKTAVREQVLSARRVLLHHRWAARVIESRTAPTPAVLGHLDSVIGTFRDGGLSADLTHHAMHALGSRLLGFSRELFTNGEAEQGPAAPGSDKPDSTEPVSIAHESADPGRAARMAEAYPRVAEIAAAAAHDPDSAVGGGCDDQFEFEFALDLLLDGIERLHGQGWTSARTTP
ncbi:TetR/AcrR family transcriptional regulator C-terminal domain-containing protein [Streptomyces sp. NBC_00090]|uniref:TetR/AcrR family transcriptional regulator C-terminal domain-containing protein n=1 Tax=Streptomyces sp. NBC_00090 TaxID=2903619 RepID=UPI00325422B0